MYWLSLGDGEVAGRVEFAPRTVAAGGGVATVAAANPGANCNPSFPAHQLAADAGNVYWSIASGVLKIPLDGGPTTLLAEASVDVPASFCATVAVDASGLYLATSYLVQASLAGGPPVSVYTFNYQPPFMLGVIEGVVFWPIYAVRGVHGGAIAASKRGDGRGALHFGGRFPPHPPLIESRARTGACGGVRPTRSHLGALGARRSALPT